MYSIIVWKKKDGSLYYRYDNLAWHYRSIGDRNGYDHEIVLIIDIPFNPRPKLKKRVITRVILFLQKIEKKI